MNTSITGANVKNNVYKFPVLIRLDSTNFDFTQAAATGTDIRFAKSNGTHLFFERERWDDFSKVAELWVLCDTVYGNNNTQYIKMYWGKWTVQDSSNPGQVFKTTSSYNFQAVWHFGENTFYDATSNYNDGTNFGTAEADGIIGKGRLFDGNNDYIGVPDDASLRMTANMTISAWICRGKNDTWSYLVEKGYSDNDNYSLYITEETRAMGTEFQDNTSTYRKFEDPSGKVEALAVQQVAFVYDDSNNKIYFYINGRESNNQTTTYSLQGTQTDSLTIGAQRLASLSYYFKGIMDEVQLSNVARSADWIKLSYENQCPAQTLVRDEDYSTWSGSKNWTVNTSSTGANVAGLVTEFPLLIRLDSTNFSFTAAQAGGRDIRFARPIAGGTRQLDYEIERWDGTNKRAEVWVRVDSVKGGNSSQYITMYWGNPTALNRSSGERVFDVSQGHAGVWHLTDNGPFNDATWNANDLSNNASLDAAGVIGEARSFDGTNTHLYKPDDASLDLTRCLTISAWVKLDNVTNNQNITSKMRDVSGSWYGYSLAVQNGGFFPEVRNSSGTQYAFTSGTVSAGQWTHLMMTWETGDSLRGYVNGVKVNSKYAGTDDIGTNASDLTCGIASWDKASFPVDGIIDEVCISHAERNANWIKLCYENQKPNQTLVLDEDYSTWANSKIWKLVTTAIGANVSGTVYDFPVLIRLDSINFAFTQAAAGGADIRFANSQGHHLNYEIERWDAVGKCADIWVRVDTILGNNSTQYIKMHWGKSGVISKSRGDLVFNESNGFTAAYHLKESSGTKTVDASANLNDAVFQGNLPAQRTGVVGYGQYLDGNGDRASKSSGSGLSSSGVSVMAWINVDANRDYNGIAMLDWNKAGAWAFYTRVNGNVQMGVHNGTAETYALKSGITPGAWYHVAGTYDGSTIKAYLDGVAGTSASLSQTLNNSGTLTIGNTLSDFKGMIDEIWISRTARSQYWVKLSYENQKLKQSLVFDEYGPITITSHPRNDTVVIGDTALFTTVASAINLRYQWQKRAGTGSPVDIAGAVSYILKFKTGINDTQTSYRCILRSGPLADTTDSARLIVGMKPVIISVFSKDTVLAAGKGLTLKGSASGIPKPSIVWCFIDPVLQIPLCISPDSVLSLNNLGKTDSGTFYFTASNDLGSVSSDSIFVHVLDPVNIVLDLPAVYYVPHGGEALFSIWVTGDGLLSYQWYVNGSIMPGSMSSSLSINPVDSVVHKNNRYNCIVKNTFLGRTVSTDTSATATLKISTYYNPFKVKVEPVAGFQSNRVRVKIWSDMDISNFPTALTPFTMLWADSLLVMYKTLGFATTSSEATIVKCFVEDIKKAAPDSLKALLTVKELPAVHDSCYYFNYSVLWHHVGFPDTLLKPFAPVSKLFVLDTISPPNPLRVHGEYIMRSDSARLIIDSISGLDTLNDSIAIIQCSKYPDFNTMLLDTHITVPALIASGACDTVIVHNLGMLPIETYTAYCRWYIKARNPVQSVVLDTTFNIGWDRPVYAGTLFADSAAMGDRMHLAWDAPQAGTDSVRIWWNVSPIPLVHNPSLPLYQAQYIFPATKTIDTIKGLSNYTVYYFGLQIFKDEMWSSITAKSSDTATTATGDTLVVANVVAVDSARFDTLLNSMIIHWHVDLSNIPGNRTYQMGSVYTLDTIVDSLTLPRNWDSVAFETNIDTIALYPEITFDTAYTVGLWLRGVSPSPVGPGKPSAPTDSGTAKITIPSFTWQEVEFFPASQTVYAANKKIMLDEITHFVRKDTLRAYKPGTLPAGFVHVGGVSFTFSNKDPGIPSFTLGLKYGALPAGVSVSDLGFYQAVNGDYHVLYDFKLKDGVVWTTVKGSGIKYPFLILADTLPLQMVLTPFNDTITKGSLVANQFVLNENTANARWSFLCGRGDRIYTSQDSGYLDKSFDTSSIVKNIPDSLISDVYGVRAQIIASDGVHNDTVNVSRCVRRDKGENFPVAGHEWVPLRTGAGLDERSLDKIFDLSVNEPDPWVYDIYRCRLYRWYSPDSVEQNYWLEYSESAKSEFDFIPGRVIWSKTLKDQTIAYGPGVTTSLKEPYEIVLKPKNWTDFSLPFQFPVLLKDVLLATTPYYSSLEVYRWVKTGMRYEASALYIYSLDNVADVNDTLVSKQKYDAYTVYNNHSSAVKLLIPAVPIPLSKNRPLEKKKADNNTSAWNIRFMWRNTSEGEEEFNRKLIFGYKEEDGPPLYGFLPPSMSKTQAGIHSNTMNTLCGWALKRELEAKGGVSFEVVVNNASNTGANIEYRFGNLETLPGEFKARVYDTKYAQYEECAVDKVSAITLAPEDKASRLIAVGPDEYLEYILQGLMPFRFIKAYPNPFRNLLRLHYSVPVGIREVEFTLYNLQGRALWQESSRAGAGPGEHVYNLTPGKRELSAGIYILRLSAKNNAGKTVYGDAKMVTCIK